MASNKHDAAHERRDHRPRVGRHQGAEQAAAQMVALDLLRHHRLGDRLLARLCRPGRLVAATPRACSATASARRWLRSSGSQGCARPSFGRRSPRAISRRSTTTPSCCASRSPAARPRSATIARPATAAAPRAAFGYPNLSDDSWLWGGDAHRPSMQTAFTHGIQPTIRRTRESRRIADAGLRHDRLLTEAQIADAAEYVLSLSGRPTDKAAAERGEQDLRRPVRALSRCRGKGNPAAGRAQPDGRALALRRRQGDDRQTITTAAAA